MEPHANQPVVYAGAPFEGADAFIASQMTMAASDYPTSLFAMPIEAVQERMMANALTGPDQLRQRGVRRHLEHHGFQGEA